MARSAKGFPGMPTGTNYTDLLDVVQNSLGFDPSILINISVIIAAISTFIHYAGGRIYSYASELILSSIHINEDDDLYECLMRWMTDHQLTSKRFRSVKATTAQNTSWEDEEDATRSLSSDDSFDASKLISYRTLVGRPQIKLRPWRVKHLFAHRGIWIYFKHTIHQSNALQLQAGNPAERGFLTIQCLGRSLDPLKALLEDAQLHQLQMSMSTTNIFRGMTNMREMLRWSRVISRPSRDIRTVILERVKKHALLADVNEYLHPRTRRWYANHGVPYRRGYLFSGAPGTGKTSLTAALAGVFGLDIYVLSLLDPALTEGQFMRLLSEVPSRCIVLLEDIDAAGLKRPGDIGRTGPKDRRSRRGGGKDREPASAIEELAGVQVTKPATDISLSGLLNAIDGVSSQEGRILIMTTNAPEELDKALIRPGRVDIHIAFELPGRTEMHELFLSMYRDILPSNIAPIEATVDKLPTNGDLDVKKSASEPKAEEKANLEELKPLIPKSKTPNTSNISDLMFEASDELNELAARFSEALPDRKLSLASIQGFLLGYKHSPRLACENARQWGEKAAMGEEGEGSDGERR